MERLLLLFQPTSFFQTLKLFRILFSFCVNPETCVSETKLTNSFELEETLTNFDMLLKEPFLNVSN